MLLLAVQVDEQGSELFYGIQRHQRAVYTAQALALIGDFTGDLSKTVVVLDLHIVEKRLGPAAPAYVEQRPHPGFFRAGSHHFPAAAVPQRQIHAVHHYAFARAGLAGQRIKPPRKFYAEAVDKRDILYVKLKQHFRNVFPSVP